MRLEGGDVPGAPLYIGGDGIEGWRGTPSSKWALTERAGGNGAHAIEEASVLYSARTVTLHAVASGEDREGCVEAMALLGPLVGRNVRLTVADEDETFADGCLSVEWGSRRRNAVEGAITVVCPDPRRYSTSVRRGYLGVDGGSPAGGLQYDGDGLIRWPLRYGADAAESRSLCTVQNAGTAPMRLRLTASGAFGDLTVTDVATGRELSYASWVGGQPVVMDSATRTASCNGVDVTRNVTTSWWPEVPAGGALTLSLRAAGAGSVAVEGRDTYI